MSVGTYKRTANRPNRNVVLVANVWYQRIHGFEMSDLHRKVLRTNQRFLLNNIIFNAEFIAVLYESEIFTDNMIDDITVGSSTDCLKQQQISALKHLIWSSEQHLTK